MVAGGKVEASPSRSGSHGGERARRQGGSHIGLNSNYRGSGPCGEQNRQSSSRSTVKRTGTVVARTDVPRAHQGARLAGEALTRPFRRQVGIGSLRRSGITVPAERRRLPAKSANATPIPMILAAALKSRAMVVPMVSTSTLPGTARQIRRILWRCVQGNVSGPAVRRRYLQERVEQRKRHACASKP